MSFTEQGAMRPTAPTNERVRDYALESAERASLQSALAALENELFSAAPFQYALAPRINESDKQDHHEEHHLAIKNILQAIKFRVFQHA